MPRKMPKRPRLKKGDEKSAIAVLSKLPLVAPAVEIEPLAGEEFQVELVEAGNCFVPLEVGALGFHVDYDGLNHEFLEAGIVEVTRRVKALGMWGHEVQNIGGTYLEGRFSIIWHEVDYYHANRAYTYNFNEHGIGPKFPRHLAMLNEIKWENLEVAHGPVEAQSVVCGFNKVSIAGHRFSCLRAITVYAIPCDPEEPDESSGWYTLDEAYVSNEGRTVLLRRYETKWHRNELARFSREMDEENWPAGRAHIRYNGVDFYHWFDCLAGYALGWPD